MPTGRTRISKALQFVTWDWNSPNLVGRSGRSSVEASSSGSVVMFGWLYLVHLGKGGVEVLSVRCMQIETRWSSHHELIV